MPERIAVLVPGIMGSILRFDNTNTIVWSDNFTANYRMLCGGSTNLRWDGNTAQSQFMISAFFEISFVGKTFDLWGQTIKCLKEHNEFSTDNKRILFSYDWRQSLIESAKQLGTQIDSITQKAHAESRAVKFVFIAHSMGGLLVRIAIAEGNIKRDKVDTIIQIGSPLKGSQGAFKGLYDPGYLGYFETYSRWLVFPWGQNKQKFYSLLLENFRTFPSAYQLLPPEDIKYVKLSGGATWFNPLSEDCIANEYVDYAQQAHRSLLKAATFLKSKQNKIKSYTIFTQTHTRKPTDETFTVRNIRDANSCRYEIHDEGTTFSGDGAVLAFSASDKWEEPVENVRHDVMCSDQSVVKILKKLL